MNSDPATAKAWSPRAFPRRITATWEANEFLQEHFNWPLTTSEEATQCHPIS
jgi:hypothetical protein